MSKSDKPGLDELVREYERAEITILWRHRVAGNGHSILFAVVEFCPNEQEESETFIDTTKNGKHVTLRRASGGEDGETLYVTRRIDVPADEALRFFRGAPDGTRTIVVDGSNIPFDPISTFGEEPPNDVLLLVEGDQTSGLSSVLPRRLGNIRVSSRYADALAVLTEMSAKQRSAVSKFSSSALGFDLTKYFENLGAIHLMLSNPILRHWTASISPDERQVLLNFYERDGKSAIGLVLQLTEQRENGTGFVLRVPVTSQRMTVDVPYRPGPLRYELFDSNGSMIDGHTGVFIKHISIGLAVSSQARVFETEIDGVRTKHEVPVFSHEAGAVAKPQTDLHTLFNIAKSARASTPHFRYFKPGSTKEAREFLRSLFGRAKQRVLLCDPYLSADDVRANVLFVPTSRLPIQLLSSAAFLAKQSAKAIDEGQELRKAVEHLTSQDRTLNIETRVLSGRKKSPVHDRFLLIDQEVHLLGSSINEFGSRGTTAIRVPAEARFEEIVIAWWDNAASLDAWLNGEIEEGEESELEKP